MKITAIVFIFVYFAVLLYFGVKGRKKDSSDDYFLGSRSFSPWVLALTFIASWYGGSSCIVSSNEAFKSGISSFWIISAPNALAPFILIFFAIWIRNLRITSMVEAADKRYKSPAVNGVLTFIVAWYMITFAASQVVAMGKFFSAYFGFSYAAVCLLGTIVVMIYAFFGGFRGVVLTDNVQFYLLTAAMLLLATVAVFAAGGFGNIVNVLTEKDASNSVGYFDLFKNIGASLMYLVSYGLGWTISADAWQRINAARSASDAKKMLQIVVITFIPLGSLSLIIGLAGATLYDTLPEGGILPALITTYLNPFLAALVFVGIGAAIMSTMSTAINTGAMTLAEDLYKKVDPNASPRKLVIAGMVSTIIVTVFALVIALRLSNILWVLWMSADILCCSGLCLLLGGFLWKRATKEGALLSMAGGGLFVLYNQIVDLGVKLPTFWPGWPYRLLVGLAIGIVLYVVGSLLSQPDNETSEAFLIESRTAHD